MPLVRIFIDVNYRARAAIWRKWQCGEGTKGKIEKTNHQRITETGSRKSYDLNEI